MGTLYHYQAYAINAVGTTYGGDQTFSTLAGAVLSSSSPTLTAQTTNYGTAATAGTFNVSGTNMTAGILVTPPTGFEVSTDNATFSSTITVGAAGTIASTPVYVRLAANTVSGSYSGNVQLTSLGATEVDVAIASSTVNAVLPTITDLPVTTVSTTAATMNATVTDGGAATTVTFLVSPVQATVAGGGGSVPTGSGNGLSITAGSGNTSSNFTDVVLSAGTTYYYQVHASNSAGAVVGAVGSFTALPSAPSPSVAGNSATVVSIDWAAVTGAVSYTYDVATDNAFTSIVSGYSSVSTTATGVTITGLSGGTQYYFRIKAVVTGGATGAYSSTLGFVTLASPNFTANYDFNSANGTSPDLTPVPVTEHVTQGSFTASGATSTNASGRFNASTWGTGTSINTNNYFSVTVTPASGYNLSLSALGFTVQRSSTGPAKYSVRSSIDNYAADLPGTITSNANLTVSSGIFTNSNTTAAQTGTNITIGSSFTNLTGPVTFRIYAFNASNTGTFSVDNVKFTGSTAQLPTVTTTTPATNIAATTVTLSGSVSSAGSSSLTDEGIVYSTSANPTIATGTQVSAGTTTVGAFSSSVTGLTSGTLYHYVAYATSSVGTSYGADQTFTTSSATPTISTTGTLSALSTTYGTASTSGTFNVSGTNMTAGILVTPPSGFEVSTDNSTFTSTVTIGAAGAIASTPVYIRLTSTAASTSYSGNVVLSSSGATNANVATVSSTVSAVPITITATNVNKTYGNTLTGGVGSTTYTLSSGTLQNGNTLSSVTIAYGTGAAATDAATTYTGQVTPSAAVGANGFLISNYTISYATGDIIVGKIALTVTATGPSKTYGTALTAGTSSTNFTVTGTPASGEALTSVTLTPDAAGLSATTAAAASYAVTPSSATGTGGFAASNYNITYTAFSGTVGQLGLTVTATGPSKTYGTALTAGTSTTNFTVTGTLASGEALTSVTLTPDAAGLSATTAAGASYAVTPSSATGTGGFASSNYNIMYTAFSGTVGQLGLTVTATGPSKTYGTALTAGTSSTNFTVTGTPASGEALTSVTLTPDAAGLSATTAATASYVVTPSAATGTGGFSASNYNITYTAFTGSVGQIALTVTATGPSKTYGTALTTGTSTTNFTVTGAPASGETLTGVTLTPDAAGLSATTAAAASYTVTPSAATGTGGFSASNYNITYTAFTGSVGQIALTVTATGPSKTYGTALTTGTSTTNFTVTGAPASGETLTGVTLTPDAAGLSATTAAAASYTVTPSAATGTGGFLASNYNITYTAFTGTVGKIALTVTATGPSKIYGTALTAGTSTTNFTVTGTLASGEALTSVTLTPDAAGLSATTAAGASYTVTPSAATGTSGFLASNYNITYTPFSGTVGKIALTVTATGPSKTYGTALTAGTSTTNFTVTGTPASGEALTSVTLTPDVAGLSATTAAGVSYAVTPSSATGTGGFAASNYNITYTAFSGTVGQLGLTVTATGPSKTYGTALTAGTSNTNFAVTGTPASGEALTSVTLTPDAAGLSATTAAGASYAVTPSSATGTGGFAASNYNITYTPFSGSVGKIALTVTATSPAKTYGTALTAGTSSTNFTVTGTPASGEALTSVTLTPDAAGLSATTAAGASYTVAPSSATGTGGFLASSYNITYTPFSGTVGKIALTVTATGPSKTYGTALTAGTSSTNFTVTGTPASGEALTSVTLTPDAAGLSATTAAGALYAITPSSATGTGGFAANNYNITYTPFSGTVGQFGLTVTATGPSKTYGTALTAGTSTTNFTVTGTLASGEALTSVTLTPDAAGLSATTAAGASYAITPSSATGTGGFAASNYNITYTPFSGTVAKSNLSITASTANKTYGQPLTSGSGFASGFTSSGLKNSESIGTVTLTYGTGAAATANVGTYTNQISPSAATGGTFTASNYNITYNTGNIVIGTASLTIDANGVSKVPGTTITGGSGSTAFAATGLQNGETAGTVTITYGSGANAGDAPGTYVNQVQASALTGGTITASNYTITYTNGDIVVGTSTITVNVAGGALQPLSTSFGTASGTTTFTVSGSNLSNDITITPPTGFEVASSSGGPFGSTVTLTASSGGVGTTNVYVRLAATTAVGSSYNGNVVASSSGATSQNVATQTSTVSAVPLTITAGNATTTYGTAITGSIGSTAYTLTSGTLKNGNTISSVTIAYSTGALATATATTYTGSVTPSAAVGANGFVASNYNITYATGNIIVNKAPLTITATGPAKTYGTALTTGTSTTNFTAGTAVGGEAVTGVTLTPDAAGLSTTTAAGAAYTVTPSLATGSGGFLESNYNITYTPYNGTVGKIPLTVTATGPVKTYGTALSAGTSNANFTVTGTPLTGEALTSVTLTPDAAGLSATTAAGISYAVTPSAATGTGGFAASNYNITYTPFSGTVGKIALTVTATGPAKTYGTALVAGTSSTNFTVTGTPASGEALTGVTLTPDAAGLSATTAAGISYAVTPSAATGTGGFTAGNYNITYTSFSGTVGQIALTVTATGPAKAYGTALTAGTSTTNFTVTGTPASGEALTGVTLTPDAAGLSATTAAGASYAVTPSSATGTGGFAASNYNITYAPFSGTVGKIALTVTATGPAKTFGTALTTGTTTSNFTVTGTPASGEALTSVTLTPDAAGLSASTAAGSSYSVTPGAATGTGGFSAGNYTITYTAFSSAVAKANLSITANNATKTYGQSLVGGSGSTAFTPTGLQGTDAIGSVAINYGTGNATSAAVGTYSGQVTPSFATGGTFVAGNYNITYNTGNIIINAAPLTITATDVNKVSGATLTGGSGSTAFTTTGLQNSETVGTVTVAYGTGSAAGDAPGTYIAQVTPSAATGGTFTTGNYNITYAKGNIIIGTPTINTTGTLVALSTTYGTASGNTSFGVSGNNLAGDIIVTAPTGFEVSTSSSTGFGSSLTLTQTSGSVSSTTVFVRLSATAAANSYSGNITLTSTSASAVNVSTVSSTVSPAALTLTANGAAKTYGTAITGAAGSTAYSITSGSLKNGNTVSSVTIAYGTGSAATAAVNTYTGQVTPSAAVGANGFVSGNYNITYAAGDITVNKVNLSITATGPAKTYGTALTAVTSTSNFTAGTTVNSETVTSVTLTPDAAGLSASTAAGASYTVTPSLATGTGGFLASNYTITYVPFNGTVTKAALTVTATGPGKTYGTTLTAGTSTTNFTATGTITGETVAGVTLTPDAAGLAATTAAGAAYTVTPSLATGTGGFLSANYTITYVPFNGTVSKIALTVTATGPTKAYGTALTAGTSTTNFTVTGTSATGEGLTSVTLTPDAAGLSATTAAGAAYTVTPGSATGTGGFLAANYTITYVPFNGTVSKATLTIAANNATKVYGTTNPTLSVTYTGFVGTDNAASLTTQPAISTIAVTSSAVGTYPITASGAVSNNYSISYTAGTLTINQATLTIAANNASKVYGGANPTLAVTYTGFVGTDNAASLTTQPTITTTAVTTSPVGTYPVTASGAVSANYSISYTAGTLTVTQATLTIAANNATKVYGAANPTLAVTYTGFVGTDNAASLTTQPTIATTAATGSPVGAYPITASGAVSANYSISYTAGTLAVTQATLTIAVSNATKVYGAVNPTLAVTYTGFVGTDNAGSLTTQPTITTTAVTTSPVGTYPITASGAVSANYSISYTAGTLTVTQATLTIAGNNATKVYGATNPTLSVTYTGFVGTDNAASLTTQPTINTTAVTNSPVGTYPITASGAVSANYSISYTAGTLTVTQAALTIAANNAAKTYGSANPTLAVTYAGFVGTDNAASLTTQPTIATTAVTTSPVGTYPITASGAVSANYSISYTAATLTVNKATLTITANNATKVYATANPVLGVSYIGFVNGDTNTSLTTQPTVVTTAVTTSSVGTYPVAASGTAAANYTISYVAGTLTVTPATLTITAGSGTKVYATANPAFTVSYVGFVNGDTNASLTTQPTIGTTAVTGSAVGTYPVTASGAVSVNYSVSYIAGTLAVTPATLSIVASNTAKVYGSANPTSTAVYIGFVNGDTQASLTTQPTLTTTAVTGSPAGTYPITASGAVSANYTISYTAGTLTVTPAALTIAANNQTKVLNAANPTLTATYTGFVNGDTNASLTTQPTLVTTTVLASPVGTYPITASGAASANYTISYVAGTLTVTASPNANLANLLISSGTLSPAFAQATTVYAASVANGVTSITLTPTTADPTSTVKVNGVSVTSGSASGSIPLVVGSNVITTVVTAQNGTTVITYTTTVTRAPSSNASLANLTISSGTLSPAFATATYTYTTLVDNTVSQFTVTPTLADATATILINGQPAASAQGTTLNLVVGDNIITVFTTAQDGVTKLTYTLTVHRATAPAAIKPNNILSPNGDGKNDIWVVKDIQSYPNNTVTIYDRAGRVIYTKHTYTNDWSGTFQGSPLAEGTYYYVIDLGTGDDPIKGFVTILKQR
jgi:gliding motility-associated-like protein